MSSYIFCKILSFNVDQRRTISIQHIGFTFLFSDKKTIIILSFFIYYFIFMMILFYCHCFQSHTPAVSQAGTDLILNINSPLVDIFERPLPLHDELYHQS